MTRYSRTARPEDKNMFALMSMIQTYMELPKKYDDVEGVPEYRFWDYAIVFAVAKELGLTDILDVGFNRDLSFELLCNYNNITYNHIHPNALFEITVIGNKHQMVSCLGDLEHFEADIELFIRMSRHVQISGILVVTTDGNTIESQKFNTYDPEDLLTFSTLIEHNDYEVYKQNELEAIDYLDDEKNVHSIVIHRIGAKKI